jgi:S1-C subfamily serine protease
MNRIDPAYEQIERYLSGGMAGPERTAFERNLAHDEALAEEVRKQRLLTESLELYGKRVQLKKQLDAFHQELEAEETTAQFRVNRYGLRVLWKKYLPTVAVAASVALLTVLSTLLTLTNLRSLDNRQTSFYQQMKRDMEIFKKATTRAISNASSPRNVPEVKVARYSATGFMISPNGYVVTNYHVVQEADSVYIESLQDSVYQYKVKVIYKDSSVDLALLKIEDPGFQPPKRLPFALSTQEADLAQPVYTLGYPGNDLVYNDGSISSHRGFDGDTSAYRISIPVNPGNSGGPLLDNSGNLIGVISGKNTAAEGASFAVKAKYLMKMIEEIPTDSLPAPVMLPRKNYVKELDRPTQIKRLQSVVFNVKVYKSGV